MFTELKRAEVTVEVKIEDILPALEGLVVNLGEKSI